MANLGNGNGNYNKLDRMHKIKFQIDNFFAGFRNSWKNQENSTNSKNPKPGIQSIFLEETLNKIKKTHKNIDKFNSDGHFNQEFRVLREECVKHQLELDGVDCCGREDYRKIRKQALCEIETMLELLNRKTHDTGKPCEQCPLQKL